MTDLNTYFQEEIKKIKGSTRRTWMIGMPLVLFVLGYMSWMSYKMNTLVFVPKHIALYIAQGVDREAPKVIKNTERQITSMAPAVARAFNNEVHNMINELDHIGSHQVEAFKNMLPVVDKASQQAVDNYFKVYGAEVKASYEEEGADKLAERMVDSIFEKIGDDLKNRVYIRDGNKVEAGPANVSLAFLDYIHERLNTLSKKRSSKMTASERLERRLIVAWANALGAHFKIDLTAQ